MSTNRQRWRSVHPKKISRGHTVKPFTGVVLASKAPANVQAVLLYNLLQLVQLRCLHRKRCCWPRRDSMSDDEAGPRTDSDQADFKAPSVEQAAAVQAHEEDDDVAYDDEPDEAEGEGNVNVEKEPEHSAGPIQGQVQCSLCSFTRLQFALFSLLC